MNIRAWNAPAKLCLLAVLVVTSLGIPLVISSDSRAPSPPPRKDWVDYTALVEAGPFRVDLVLDARLEAGRSVTLSSSLPSNMAKILELAPDGSYLKAGDLVARFDRRPLEEAVRKLQAKLRDQNGQLQQLRADHALLEEEAKERAAQLVYQVQVAEKDRDQLVEIDLPAREARSLRDLRKARATTAALRGKRDTQAKLTDRGLGTPSELARAEAELREAEADQAIAEAELEGLRKVTLPAERRHADLQLRNRQRERRSYAVAIAQRLEKQLGTIKRAENKLASLEEELDEAHHHLTLVELRAPVTGILLHRRVSAGLEKRKPQVGDSLWKGHAFAVIPDMASMIAEAEVSERELGKLAVGQAVTLAPDAYPDLHLQGSIASIGTLIEANDGEPRFDVRITLEGSSDRLRPGMSGRAAVRTATFDHALRVPVQSVFSQDQSTFGFVLRGDDIHRVSLALGPSDGRDIVIEGDVQRGDRMLLVYPENLR